MEYREGEYIFNCEHIQFNSKFTDGYILVTDCGSKLSLRLWDEMRYCPICKSERINQAGLIPVKCHPDIHPAQNIYGKVKCKDCGNYYEAERKLLEKKLQDCQLRYTNEDWKIIADCSKAEFVKLVEEVYAKDSKMNGIKGFKDKLIEEVRKL